MSAAPDPPGPEDDLHAYVDGLLPAARAAAVGRALQGDPATAARVEAWRRHRALLRAAYSDRAAGGAGAGPDLHRWRRRRLARAAAAAFLALSAGAAAGWAGRGAQAPDGPTAAEVVRDTLDTYRLRAAAAEPEAIDGALAARLGFWLGHEVAVPDLAGFGLRLARAGRLRTAAGAPAAALTYADVSGEPYVLYIVQMPPSERPALVHLEAKEGGRLVYWPYEEYRCVLQGRADPARLRAIAGAVELQLREVEEAEERRFTIGHG